MGLFFNGCEVEEVPQDLQSIEEGLDFQVEYLNGIDEYVNFMEPYESVDLNGYTITLKEYLVSGSTTTFVYSVAGNQETAQSDSFYLAVPDCASGLLQSWSPTQSSKLEDGRLKWNSSISKDGTQEFSLIFDTEVRLGLTEATMVRGGIESSTKVLGPCGGIYTISGSIFIDADIDETKDPGESGIGGYTIKLAQDTDGDGEANYTDSVETSADGSYSFEVLEGVYKVSVGDDLLNDQNYTATTLTEQEVNVSSDVKNVNFGYEVEAEKITEKFIDNTIPLDTEDYKFWIQQLKNPGKGKSEYTREEINELLTSVEGLLLDDPFQFQGNKIKAALDILSKPIKTDIDLYLQQLLTAELNVLSGRGALLSDGSLNEDFNKALMIYGEAIACLELGTCPSDPSTTQARTTNKAGTRSLSTDIQLVTSFNNGSGGL
jgi:hypothetical protein